MTNQQKCVDVLAVMDAQSRHTRQFGGSPSFQTIDEARAAVAELIEAAIDAHDFGVNTARNDGREIDRRFYRLRAALARVQGGSNG